MTRAAQVASRQASLPDGDHIVESDLTRLQRLANHVAGRLIFGQAGRVEFLIRIAFRQHFTAGVIPSGSRHAHLPAALRAPACSAA